MATLSKRKSELSINSRDEYRVHDGKLLSYFSLVSRSSEIEYNIFHSQSTTEQDV